MLMQADALLPTEFSHPSRGGNDAVALRVARVEREKITSDGVDSGDSQVGGRVSKKLVKQTTVN